MARLLVLVSLLIGLVASQVGADRNFTIYHYTQGTNCQGSPFLIQKWSKPGPNNRDCSLNIPSGTAQGNTPQAFEAFCFTSQLSLTDKVNLLQLNLYYNAPVCANGATEDETPLSAVVGLPGNKCYAAGTLFKTSAVKIFHDCNSPATRMTISMGILLLSACISFIFL